ncbi:MAG: NUDIX domain-containing protein [Clostridia bacterium]|jgi:8-oxo-dGTP diphosphatase|nr:nUDIX domain protein [Clostridium sp. CAG:571]HJJ06964.1 NUDIX domain-containing protein [Clostridiaceae bacterium]HJJ13525.1 NUDIX domain-containing protein [Clostridiaceae bacterium]
MEKRDLYDINRNLTGETIFKDEKTPKDRYILVVLVFIQNSKGDFLIQKRSKLKDSKYGSTGGHPKTGENSIQGMMTEIKEEIGLDVQKDDLKLFYSDRDDKDQVFFDLYYMKKDLDINTLVLQEEEVESIEWDSLEDIQALRDAGKFKRAHAEAFDRLLKLMNNN